MTLGLNLAMGLSPSALSIGASFSIALTGLTDGEARPGAHLGISYTIDPDNGTETVAWGTSAGDATYGTGPSPTDFTAGDGGSLFLTVTDDGVERSTSALIRYAAPVAAGALPDQTIAVGDTDTIATAGDFTFSGTRLYSLTTAPSGMTINSSTGAIDASAVAVGAAQAVVVRLADANDTSRFAESGFSLTVDNFTLQPAAEGTLEINGATGVITITVTSPAAYANYDAGNGAGIFTANSADLATGPVNLVPPQIIDDGSPAVGETLTLTPGLWIYDPDNGGLGTATYQWEEDGGGSFGDITGADASSYTLTSNEAGDNVRVRESLTDNGGPRSAPSPAVSVAASGPTVVLLDNFDTGYSLDDPIASSANWNAYQADSGATALVTPVGTAQFRRGTAGSTVVVEYSGAVAADQAIEVEIANFVDNDRVDLQLAVRSTGNSASNTFVSAFFKESTSELFIREFSAGTLVGITTVSYTPLAAGDKARLEISGTTATVLIDTGSCFSQIGQLTGIALTSGTVSVGGFITGANSQINIDYVQIEEL